MGLNLGALAALQKKVEPAAASQEKSAVTSSLAALSSLVPTSQSKELTTTPVVESAGVIKYQEVFDKIASLDTMLKNAHPQMPVLLQEIWKTLKLYPECVTLLREEDMEIVISGLEKQVDVDLSKIVLKAATKSGGKKTPISAAQLGF